MDDAVVVEVGHGRADAVDPGQHFIDRHAVWIIINGVLQAQAADVFHYHPGVALGVLAVGLPIFLAATRTEAILGAIAGFMVAADLLMAVSFVSSQQIAVHWLSRSMPLGVVAAVLAIPVAAVGIVVGPVASELGFGHSSGLRAVLAGAVVALALALAGPYVG